MSKEHLELGRAGEKLAASLLRKNGYRILEKNYKTRLGEIDIIAKDRDAFCFVEVKTRHSQKFGLPAESLLRHKQRQIAKSALVYLKANNLLDKSARFDVVSVTYAQGEPPRLDLIKNAFELDASFTY